MRPQDSFGNVPRGTTEAPVTYLLRVTRGGPYGASQAITLPASSYSSSSGGYLLPAVLSTYFGSLAYGGGPYALTLADAAASTVALVNGTFTRVSGAGNFAGAVQSDVPLDSYAVQVNSTQGFSIRVLDACGEFISPRSVPLSGALFGRACGLPRPKGGS